MATWWGSLQKGIFEPGSSAEKVVLQVLPSWRTWAVVHMLELGRSLRLLHIRRVFKVLFKESFHTVVGAMPWVFSSDGMLALLLYVGGVLCARFVGQSPRFAESGNLPRVFATPAESIYTLFTYCTFEGWTEDLRHMKREGVVGVLIVCGIVMLMLVAYLAFFNIAAAAMIRIIFRGGLKTCSPGLFKWLVDHLGTKTKAALVLTFIVADSARFLCMERIRPAQGQVVNVMSVVVAQDVLSLLVGLFASFMLEGRDVAPKIFAWAALWRFMIIAYFFNVATISIYYAYDMGANAASSIYRSLRS